MKLFTFCFFPLIDMTVSEFQTENECYMSIMDLLLTYLNMFGLKACKSAQPKRWISYKKLALISADQKIIGFFFLQRGIELT